MAEYDVIVIGGGFSGLNVGALLANAGRKVLLLEKGNYLGGRGFSTEYKGQIIDHGAHVIARTGYLEEIFSRLGKAFPEVTPATFRTNCFYEGKWQDFGEVVPREELRRIIGEEILPRSYDELEEYDDIGLEEWLSKRTKNKEMHLFFWCLAHLWAPANEIGTCSAASVLILIKEFLEKATYYDGPYADHLNWHLINLNRIPKLRTAMKQIIETQSSPSDLITYRLESAGLVERRNRKVLPRYGIYEEFFTRHL